MDEDREQKVADISSRLRQGEYHVDPRAVADAILARWREAARAPRGAPGTAPPSASQNECSYPDRPASPSANVTPGAPASTRPTQVTDASAWWRLLGGMQTHSS
jgi:hypothetical protein